MDITNLIIKGFLILFGIGTPTAIIAWFVIDIRQRRKLGLPVLDMGTPASMIILYQPDATLKSRISVDNLSVFIQLIQQKALPMLSSKANPDFDLLVGIKPKTKARFWIIPTGVDYDSTRLAELLKSIPTPTVSGPVVFALRIGRGSGEPLPIPEEWKNTLAGTGTNVVVPDGIFKKIWPD